MTIQYKGEVYIARTEAELMEILNRISDRENDAANAPPKKSRRILVRACSPR